MKRIEILDQVVKGEVTIKEAGVNPTLAAAYNASLKKNQELIDFSEVIWERDVVEIVAALQDAGVEEFTISSTFSGLIETVAKLAQCGVVLSGLTKVNGWSCDFETGEREKVPAYLMKISKL